ncbi:MbnP family protein [Zobellia galactanivorans]|uniref:Conserved hypothetical lipoprotein n=1 Tax=Zobellia galactanivorans (strain DSM 12802 / CCUG 47099 / CIP 106680 / NCIMB 13871 / Dsij) TaxID=63186 RepID=G0L8U9_ZOBGA|nr:MbnP family protein [Zobellia galactanivorans]CAZ94181.1 Conserved hypothetical lipoprotein [Zobellia galactanivorans]
MKHSLLALSALFALFMTSCSNDDDMSDDDALTGSGEISIKFDNGYNGNDLVLGVENAANANGEKITINRFNYIISNVRFVNKDGEEYAYDKDNSYFIISQEEEEDQIELDDIPAGEYTTLKFGVGVDQEKYLQGSEGQGDFLVEAEENNMMWSWQAGYKFLNFEGTFTSESITEATEFKIHMGSHGSSLDNYKEVVLQLPMNVRVSDEIDSNIHLKIDASKILAGATNSISLTEKQVIMVDAEKSPQIAVNTSEMFEVDHIHNGGGH